MAQGACVSKVLGFTGTCAAQGAKSGLGRSKPNKTAWVEINWALRGRSSKKPYDWMTALCRLAVSMFGNFTSRLGSIPIEPP